MCLSNAKVQTEIIYQAIFQNFFRLILFALSI